MPSLISDIAIVASQQPGIVSFDNYTELRRQLQQVHDHYLSIEYGTGELARAKRDLQALRKAKRVLTGAKKQLKEGYTRPFSKVEAQLDELIALLKEPEDRCNKHVKEIEREDKEIKIETFASTYAADRLKEHATAVLSSPSFFNKRWMNATYSDKEWQTDIVNIIDRAVSDIATILKYDADVRQASLARYYETLNMSGIIRFLETLQNPIIARPAPEPTEAGQNDFDQESKIPDSSHGTTESNNGVAQLRPSQEDEQQQYYMNLKVQGTAPQMRNLLRYLEEAGIPYERGKSGRL